MKRWLDRGFDPDSETRDGEPIEPVRVEPIDAGPERGSYLLPVFLSGIAALVLGAAVVGHLGVFTNTPTAEPTRPAPTAIAWIDTTAPAPAASTEPSETALGPGSGPASFAAPLKLDASLTAASVLVHRSTPAHFTLYLANRNAGPIPLSPCPTYRMYITGIDNSAAPIRLLNCAAIGPALMPDETLTFDMVYTPASDAPLTGLTLVWQLETPDAVQALASVDISVGP